MTDVSIKMITPRQISFRTWESFFLAGICWLKTLEKLWFSPLRLPGSEKKLQTLSRELRPRPLRLYPWRMGTAVWLWAMEKKDHIIAIDLNPLSRTARKASVSIVDNIVRRCPCWRSRSGS